jgi:succinoglycan biosynthesis transport protein ExoP
MTTPTSPDSWELADYGRALRRRWRVVLALPVIGLLIAGGVIALAPKTYTATASVSVAGLPTDSRPAKGSGVGVDMDNEARLAQSYAVAKVAAQQLKPSPDVQQLVGSITATVPANTTLMNIACAEPTASRAAACANEVAAAYLSTRRANAVNSLSGQLAAVRSKVASILPGVIKASGQVTPSKPGTTPSSSAITHQLEAKAATNELNALLGRVNSLTPELASLQKQNSTAAGRVVNSAGPPSSPSSPRMALVLPSGLVAGLIVGLIVALALELRDPRLHEAREIERVHGVPTLLDLQAGHLKAANDLGLVTSQSRRRVSELAEYVATTPSEGSFVLLVAGASAKAGIGLVAANLAAALSEARPDVFLVSVSADATFLPPLLGIEGGSGLAELLAGKATINEAVQIPRDLPDLRVIPPGTESAGAALRRNYDARRNLIAELRSQARYVIIESPLTPERSPVLTLAEFADAAIIVVEASSTKRSDVDDWLRHFERIRIRVLGAVVVPPLGDAMRPRSRLARFLRRRASKPGPAGTLEIPARPAGLPEQQ